MSTIFGCIWFVAILVLLAYPMWRIFEKIGYPGVYSLLLYVPILNLVLLWYAALNPLPFEQRGYGAGAPPMAPPPPPPPPIQP